MKLKLIKYKLFLLCLSLFHLGVKAQHASDLESYELVWSDEFDVPGNPNPEKWQYETGFIRNEELQYYTKLPENVRVENGVLILEARDKKMKNPEFVSKRDTRWKRNRKYAGYTSGSIETQGLASWQYGKFEIKAKLPSGRGLWPALWMLGDTIEAVGWPRCGEIDIMENVGFEPEKIHGTIHTERYNHTKKTSKGNHIYIRNSATRFHIYSVIWTSKSISFYVDEIKYHEFSNPGQTEAEWPFDQKFHLKLNVAVGGSWGGIRGIDDSVFPQRMEVDYVRVYQKNED